MKSQPTHIAGHLMWTRSGVVWALWRINPLPYGFRPAKDKHEARFAHQALIRALPGESLLLGVSATLDPEGVVSRMIADVDLEAHPAWAAECEATLDTLEGLRIGQRSYWLAKPLGAPSGLTGLRDAASARWADFLDDLEIRRPGISESEVERRLAQAAKIEQSLPRAFGARRASTAQMVWLHLHAQQRGLWSDGAPPEQGSVSEDLMTPSSGAAFTDCVLDEGGQSELSRKELRSWNPFERRYVKVTPCGDPDPVPSYQSLLVLADVPAHGMVFPGSEFLGRVDESGVQTDWAMRLTVRAGSEVIKQNRRALNGLNEQYKQREGELSPSGTSALDRSADELIEYAQILESDKNEVEAKQTTIFAVAGDTAESAMEQAGVLARHFSGFDYRLAWPVGDQEALWWAMLPGQPSSRVVRDYAQIATSRNLAPAMPFASTELGDDRGMALALNLSSGAGTFGIVHNDMLHASERDVPASIAIAGEKGAGKSVAMKTIAGHVIDMGGRIIATDRTASGEWARWASTSVSNAVVLDVSGPEHSLDPLRLFAEVDDPTRAAEASRAAQKFFTTLLDLPPTSELGATLSDAVDYDYLTSRGLRSSGDVLAHLLSDSCTLPGAADLGRKMQVFARKDLGKVVFDPNLPVLSRHADGIVLRTHKLEMPTERELDKGHLYRTLSIEKILGRALYALIGDLARQICFEDDSVFAAYFLDEAHHQTRTPEGLESLVWFVRDDRKHNAAAVIGSHDSQSDFGDDTLRGLIKTRIQLRQTDETLAVNGLKWMGLDADLLDMLMHDTSPTSGGVVEPGREGEGFMRDLRGNIGRIKILAPAGPTRNAAVRTTPGEENSSYQPYTTPAEPIDEAP